MSNSTDEESDIETAARRHLTETEQQQKKRIEKNGRSNNPTTNGVLDTTENSSQQRTKIYSRRYAMLTMFILLSASNAMQWIEYSIIAHIIHAYYNVEYTTVDWTSMIYMLTYMILIFPGSWFLDKYGLRMSVMIGAFGNCFGAWLKILSTTPDRFWLTFIAQTIVGSSQVFILGIPPRLAAVWFGPEQVSTACAAGVFGNQLGIAIGFILPPLLVHPGNKERINVGVFYAISTLLSQMILFYHEGEQKATGTIGLLIVVSGMFGSVVCGYILDKWHHFKMTTLIVYLFSFLGMIVFTFTLARWPLWTIFIIAIALGFFMTGYLPLGFEFAAELTFPIAEGTTSGLLNGSAQAFGIAMTFGMGKVMKIYFLFL
uniref:Major facilitator superfamily (MFS) profile domain-containing protein n=1 Tax=Meloidogyne javanica TaxID=6303 RepID=A0A915M0T1_MELJA